MALKTDFRSLGDELIIFNTSALAACRFTASSRSRFRRLTSRFFGSSIGERASDALRAVAVFVRRPFASLLAPLRCMLPLAVTQFYQNSPDRAIARMSVLGQSR